MTKIDPSAVVAPGAELGENVEIGPLCVVGPHVKIGDGTRLIAQCHMRGYTEVGKTNTFYPFSSIGASGQDFHADERLVSYVRIGDNNIFRECSTVHAGTAEGTETVIGNGCMFMANSHAGHNVRVGNNVIMVNCSSLGGYAEVGDNAILSAYVAIHQFCKVGRFVMLSAGSVFSKDIPPFMTAEGRNGALKAVNVIGLERAGFSSETIHTIRQIHKVFVRSGLNQGNALREIEATLPQIPEVVEFVQFCRNSKRGVLCSRDGHRE